MPTPTKGPRLGGGPAHERLMLANLATALFEHGRITTTTAKAKRLRPLAERLVTIAQQAVGEAERARGTRFRRGRGATPAGQVAAAESAEEAAVAVPLEAEASVAAGVGSVPTQGDDDGEAAEGGRQIAVPTEGGDTDVVTESPGSAEGPETASTSAGPGEGDGGAGNQAEAASETSQAEGDRDRGWD